MTKQRAKAKLKKLNDEIEILVQEWSSLGDDLAVLSDKRKRFVKKYGKLLGKKARTGL